MKIRISICKAALVVALMFFTGICMAETSAKAEYSAERKDNGATGSKSVAPNTFVKPDFAYPATVETNAREVLDKCDAGKNGKEALIAAIQIAVAQNLVSASSFESNVRMLDSLAMVMPQPYVSLCRLLEATLYHDTYESRRWIYDSRTLPLDSYPADVMSWSGDLFAKKVLSLVESATSDMDKARKMPVAELDGVVTDIKDASEAGLSTADFIVAKAMSLLYTFVPGQSEALLPFGKGSEEYDLSPGQQCQRKWNDLAEHEISYLQDNGRNNALAWFVVYNSTFIDSESREKFLSTWKDRIGNTPEGGRVLYAYYDCVETPGFIGSEESVKMQRQVEAWIAANPGSPYVDALGFLLARNSRKEARIDMKDHILPQTPYDGDVRLVNMNELYILIYKVPETMVDDNSLKVKQFPGSATCVGKIRVTADGEVPFSHVSDFTLPPLPAGAYVLVPSESSTLSPDWRKSVNQWSLGVVRVTDIAAITVTNSTHQAGKAYIVDARTQRPLEGASVKCYQNKKVVKSGVSGKDGEFVLPEGYGILEASRGADRFSLWYDGNRRRTTDKGNPAYAAIFTDLRVYRPGDKVRFAAVGWLSGKDGNSLLENAGLRVELLDANRIVKDTLLLTTDFQGRCEGEFTLPRSGLLGAYRLKAVFTDYPENNPGYAGIEVSEYKTPTFYVELSKDSTVSYETGDAVKFRGTVRTYSGMPLGGAAISYRVRWTPWWRWYHGSMGSASYGGELTADENGNFVIVLPTGDLKGTDFERGNYVLSVSATSTGGETQEAPSLRFSLGNGFVVVPSVPEKLCVGNDSVNLNVPVYDMMDLPVKKVVGYSVENTSSGDVVASGSFISPVLRLDPGLLPSGKYRFMFNIEGDTAKVASDVVIFRNSDNKPPYPTPLWVPSTKIVAKDGAAAVDIPVGGGFEGQWILAVVTGDDGIVRQEWIQAGNRNVSITVGAPAGNAKMWVTFSGMHDLEQQTATVAVVTESSLKKMDVKASSFRDRISAGDKEVWKFRFSVDEEMAGDVAALAVMTDKALNALVPFSWSFSPASYQRYLSTSVSGFIPRMLTSTGAYSVMPKYAGINTEFPQWNTYSYPLAGYSGRGGMMRKYGAVRDMKMANASDGEDEVAVEEEVMSTVQLTSVSIAGGNMVREESADNAADSGGIAPGQEGNAGVSADGNVDVKFRPVDMPVAFFMPDLKSDSNGEVEVVFDVPDYNTTWQFQLMGYDSKLQTAGLVLDAVASKPVMVRCNVPRFVRTGDKVDIAALLFNNSGSELGLGGEIEIFDTSTGRCMVKEKFDSTVVDPSGNVRIAVNFTVPDNLYEIGVRAYAVGDRFTDGEQASVAVLPSSSPVVESTQFYLGSSDRIFKVRLPKYRKDANLTLKYCDNPVWECMLALPSISKPDSRNIYSVSRALFANAMALSVVERYPEIKRGLQRILSSGDTVVLTSNLQKDAMLKTVELNSTPWVNDAASETERMRRLNTLLDSAAAESVISVLVSELRDLQQSDGGWSWCPGMKSSSYISGEILRRMGVMKKNDCLPSDCMDMIGRVIDYCDRTHYDNYVKSDHSYSVTDMLSYLYARSFFRSVPEDSGFSQLSSKAVEEISEEWRNFSIRHKAEAAILLWRTKGYGEVSRDILESLGQLASKDKAKGWWFDNLTSGFSGLSSLQTTALVLEAFDEISPESRATEGLRQWLVLQKETENWGADSGSVEVISAIAGSGVIQAEESVKPSVSVDGRELDIPWPEMPAGCITINLTADSVSGKLLEIGKSTGGPAWGGVVCQYVDDIKDVKADHSENLRIEKRLLVVRDTPAGEKAEEGDIHVGDKVRVVLTLTCGKDMDYVAVTDERGAFLEPADQISGYSENDGLWTYREVRNSRTSFFIGFLPKGVNVLTYDCYADREGEYSVGIASAQSQYSPLQAAHSAGSIVRVIQ